MNGALIRNGHERVIAAGDEATARLIGNAMLGEEVASSEYLAKVEVVERTNEKPTLNCWTTMQEKVIWIKVMGKIIRTHYDVRLIFENGRIVGLSVKRPLTESEQTTESSR